MTKILIVDDELYLRETVKDLLEGEGYTVEEASNGIEALAKVKKESPQLILLDAMMADMDGWEFCEKIRQDLDTAGIPIIMCTGRDTVGDVKRGFQLGISAYIMKPFDLQKLKSKIKEVLERETLI